MADQASWTTEDLVVLLHLPPVPGRTPPLPQVGNRGGPALAALGTLLAVFGFAVWLRGMDGDLALVGIALCGLGGVLTVAGLTLVGLVRAERAAAPAQERPARRASAG
jgi:hypothetical protein